MKMMTIVTKIVSFFKIVRFCGHIGSNVRDVSILAGSTSRAHEGRGGSPSDLRYSVSDYGDVTQHAAAASHSVGRTSGTSPDARRRRRRESDAIRKRRISLSDIIDRVVPRRNSVSSPMDVQESIWAAKTNYARDVRMLYKRRITTLYITAVDLRAYTELNFSGFRKILKKCVSNSGLDYILTCSADTTKF
jgi:phosphate transporter